MKPRCTKCNREISGIFDIGKDWIEDGEYIVICDSCYIPEFLGFTKGFNQ